MRTTVRLPDELYRRVRVVAAEQGVSVTSFMESALRSALEPAGIAQRYHVDPIGGNGLQPGVDLDDSSALEELMADDARS